MKIKKYIANTMPEALKQIRDDLGPDAVILNSKQVARGGVLKFFQKKKIEVVAALDPHPVSHPVKQQEKPMPPIHEPKEETPLDFALLNEVKQMKKMLELQASQTNQKYSPDYELMYQYLINQEVIESVASDLVDTIIAKHEEMKVDLTEMIEDLGEEIERRLQEKYDKQERIQAKVIHFVGPTGVGKTTTLAKIAAESILKDNKKVAFITTDTYRIAAIDQLKTYAKILNVPIEVAYTKEDYQNAIDKYSMYDVILVDTAGRNFRDKQYVRDLLGSGEKHVKTYIVLSLTAKPKDIIDIYNQFNHLPQREVILTKMDETIQYGSILNVALKHNGVISYLTNGQDVPEDLIKPTARMLTDYVVGGYFDE